MSLAKVEKAGFWFFQESLIIPSFLLLLLLLFG